MKRIAVNTVFIIAAIVMIFAAPKANADPFTHDAAMVCRWLDVDSSPASIVAMLVDMQSEGLTESRIIATSRYALSELCPEYVPAWRHAAAVVGGATLR